MPSYNKVIIMGNLTHDIDLHFTPSNKAVCDMSIAVNEYSKSESGEKKQETIFISVTVWNKQAEDCAGYLQKGDCVQVEGRLRQNKWEAKDGGKRSKIDIVASRVLFVKTKGKQDKAPVGECSDPQV